MPEISQVFEDRTVIAAFVDFLLEDLYRTKRY